MAQNGIPDQVNGAGAARVPDQADRYLVHPCGMFWDETRATAMVQIRPDGVPVDTDGPWLDDTVKTCANGFSDPAQRRFFVHGHEEQVMAAGSIKEG